MEPPSTVNSPSGTFASESNWRSHFWCLSSHPARGCRIYRTVLCVLLGRSPEATGEWTSSTVLKQTRLYKSSSSLLTMCRISKSRRDVSRKQVKILCSTEGMPTLCIWSRETTTSLYNSTSRWKNAGSNVDHQFPEEKKIIKKKMCCKNLKRQRKINSVKNVLRPT